MALTKAEMSEYLFDKLGLSKRDAKELVELFFEEIRRALENGEQVKLSGFGNFDLRDKNQRPGRNPKTGEDIPITARRVVTFRPGQKLKSRVENASPKDDFRLCCLFSIRLYSAFRMMKIAGYWRFSLESPTISIRFGACGY